MKYSNIIANDVVNGEGICVSLFMQGCDRHCKDCFNSETWDPNEGTTIDWLDLANYIIELIDKNGVQRNFSILGGEPFYNTSQIYDLANLIEVIKSNYPNIKIWIWTGYTIEELLARNDDDIKYILSTADILIDGPYIAEERDLTLPHRGSRNQRIIDLQAIKLTSEKYYDTIKRKGNNTMNVSTGATLYDMNKDLVINEPTLGKAKIKEKFYTIVKPFILRFPDKYFFLLCREQYDFTLFNFEKKTEPILDHTFLDFRECLLNRGKILSIEETETKDAIEIWLNIDNEAYVYYLFPYDMGVIQEGMIEE